MYGENETTNTASFLNFELDQQLLNIQVAMAYNNVEETNDLLEKYELLAEELANQAQVTSANSQNTFDLQS